MNPGTTLTLAAVFALSAAASSAAAETDFLARFEGSWSGSGSVQRNPEEQAHQVNCSMRGEAGEASVSIGGTCRAYLVFSRQIGADIDVDAQGRYTGTYTGSTIGPARLSGSRSGDTLALTITWPREVNGDRTAQMQIINPGNGQLRIVVSDQIGGGGPVQTTTDIALSSR